MKNSLYILKCWYIYGKPHAKYTFNIQHIRNQWEKLSLLCENILMMVNSFIQTTEQQPDSRHKFTYLYGCVWSTLMCTLMFNCTAPWEMILTRLYSTGVGQQLQQSRRLPPTPSPHENNQIQNETQNENQNPNQNENFSIFRKI